MKTCDVLVVGGGVQGLWIARVAQQAGLDVILVEAEQIGAGASGGVLGALMPHMPDGWNAKKQFQFEALVELEACVAALVAETGVDAGYERSGRIMPIRKAGFRDQVVRRRVASLEHWQRPSAQDVALQARGAGYEIDILAPDAMPEWVSPEEAPFGLLWDTLAARIQPALYLKALRASLHPVSEVLEGTSFASYDPARGLATMTDGQRIVAKQLVLAAGYQTFAMFRQTGLGMVNGVLGAGVKGQAAVLGAALPAARPVLYDDGMYVVAHTRGAAAVGSTTEADWVDAKSTDERIMRRVEQARRLSPALRDAPVIGTWAGIRPKAVGRDPLIGRPDPDVPVWVATGGFKITFGIAHKVAQRLVPALIGERQEFGVDGLPASFSFASHTAAHTSAHTSVHGAARGRRGTV